MNVADPAAAVLAHARHELRTPLNHIIGYSEMLLEEVDDGTAPAMTEALASVHRDARELVGRINELLSAARIAAAPHGRAAGLAELSPSLAPLTADLKALRDAATGSAADAVLPDIEKIEAAAEHLVALVHDGIVLPESAGAPAPDGAVPTTATPVPAAEYGAILVVDDNPSTRDLLARRLARQGYEVATAESGEEALAALTARAVDLVLLDVLMPGLNGYDVLKRLKADENLRDVPVLMISALDEMESVVRCIELGAEDYLPKPFDAVLLRARVSACLEKKRLRNLQRQHVRELGEWNRLLEQRVEDQVRQVEKLGRLKRFFSPQLAELIVTGGAEDPLKTHRREIVVVFLDLRGFTAFAETAEPEELMAVLREYHAEMGQIILAHEGTLERFTGDGMMIFFNDPVVVPNPSERAIRMAVAMRDRVKELAVRWEKLGYELDVGVGIAQGYATIGAIGFEGRWDYGAIGTVTNLAARLCGEAKGGQILVSRRVAGSVETLVDAEAVGALTLKGFARPVPASLVTGLKPAS